MDNVFSVLGLNPDANQDEIKACYHRLIKLWHPDKFQDPIEQERAQEKMIRLNIAYERALKIVRARPLQSNYVPAIEAKKSARNFLSKNQPESALRQLMRSETRDFEWYEIKGLIMLAFKQYEGAHQSFREAIRLEPDNRHLRELALNAALLVKKHNRLPYRIADKLSHYIRKIGL